MGQQAITQSVLYKSFKQSYIDAKTSIKDAFRGRAGQVLSLFDTPCLG